MVLSGLDFSLFSVILIFSLIGLVRGFLKEVASIIDWFGAFYLTSMTKSFLVIFLEKKITIPFLPDIIANVILFVLFIIILSVSTNYVIFNIKKVLPRSVNGGFGFIFGAFKGGLLSILFLSSANIIYKNASHGEPKWFEESIAYILYGNMKSDNIFSKSIENVLGDILKDNQVSSAKKVIEKNLKNEDQKLTDDEKKDMDRLLDLIVD